VLIDHNDIGLLVAVDIFDDDCVTNRKAGINFLGCEFREVGSECGSRNPEGPKENDETHGDGLDKVGGKYLAYHIGRACQAVE
jgi:hypothetical protein